MIERIYIYDIMKYGDTPCIRLSSTEHFKGRDVSVLRTPNEEMYLGHNPVIIILNS